MLNSKFTFIQFSHTVSMLVNFLGLRSIDSHGFAIIVMTNTQLIPVLLNVRVRGAHGVFEFFWLDLRVIILVPNGIWQNVFCLRSQVALLSCLESITYLIIVFV